MKAWQKQNGVLALADVPEPNPAADPLVVEVRAISLNRGEVRGVARTLFSKGAATICGLLVFEEYDSGRLGARDLERLMTLARDGRLHSPISLRRPWTELPATMRELEKREYPGKAVLEVDGGDRAGVRAFKRAEP